MLLFLGCFVVSLGYMALYILSGKGGVGKTQLSMALAYYLKSLKRRVLLVESAQVSQYSEFFSKEVGFKPVRLEANLSVASWTGVDCLGEYVGRVLKSESLARFLLSSGPMKTLINAAPGLKEIAILGKLTADQRSINMPTGFDDIVFDAPSSGHLLSMLQVPSGLQKIVGVGPMKKQSHEILKILKGDGVKVFLIENSSLASVELKELSEKLQSQIGVEIHSIVNMSKDADFPYIESKVSWLETAKDLAKFWKEFVV